MTTKTPQIWFTLEEGAEYVRLSRSTLKGAISEGRLTGVKSGKGGGGKVLLHRDDLDAFVKKMPAA